jgi:hypothetical protein
MQRLSQKHGFNLEKYENISYMCLVLYDDIGSCK